MPLKSSGVLSLIAATQLEATLTCSLILTDLASVQSLVLSFVCLDDDSVNQFSNRLVAATRHRPVVCALCAVVDVSFKT